MSRVAGMPVYAQRNNEVSSKLYNLWRRAKMHFALPMRIILPDHNGLILIIEKDEWVCANEFQNDMPIIAWTEFEDQGRAALHAPVKCKLNFYHYAASKIRLPVLNKMEQTLEVLLKKTK